LKTNLKKRVGRAVGKAVHDWNMILENDRILVGVSGGKDSQVLLKILFFYKKNHLLNLIFYLCILMPGLKTPLQKSLNIMSKIIMAE